jgi:plasmid stabilization system protein ParE
MPRVRFAPAALQDLARLRTFLRPKNPLAAQRAGEIIVRAIGLLKTHPQVGRPVEDLPAGFRELPIAFGDSGYVALYRYDENPPGAETDAEVVVLALRHQKEAGYR